MSKSILLLDDSEDELFVTKYMIKKFKYFDHIHTSKDGHEVLDYLNSYLKNPNSIDNDQPAVLLLDINMPLMDGFEFLDKYHQWLNENPEQPSMKIAIMSSSKKNEDIERSREYKQVIDFIFKPLTIKKFKAN